MRVVAAGGQIRGVGTVGHFLPNPRVVGGIRIWSEVQIVVQLHRWIAEPVVDEHALAVRNHHVVFKNVPGDSSFREVIDYELATAVVRSTVIREQSIVDNRAMVGTPTAMIRARYVMPTYSHSGSAVEIDQIVTSSHIAGDVREYLACELEADIVMVNDVALDDDARAAVDVDAV